MVGQAAKMRAHLATCKNVTPNVRKEFQEAKSERTQQKSAGSRLPQQGINNFFSLQEADFSAADKAKLNQLILNATLSANIAWQWVNNPEVKVLFAFLRSKIVLPDRRVLAGKILDQAVAEIEAKMLKALDESSAGKASHFFTFTSHPPMLLLHFLLVAAAFGT